MICKAGEAGTTKQLKCLMVPLKENRPIAGLGDGTADADGWLTMTVQ